MTRTVLDRYLLREAAAAWAGVTFVLLGVMLSTRFARFLADAAAGDLPREFLLKVVGLSSLQYLVVLIPISLLLAILLSLGRLYKDHEIAAMTGCGVGIGAMYRPFLVLATLLAALTAWLSFDAGPWAGRQVDYLVKDARRLVQYTPFESGRFKEAAGGRAYFYAAAVEPQGPVRTIFAQIAERGGTSIVTAASGAQTVDPATGERVITLRDGYRYLGNPGQAEFDVMRFGTLALRVTPPEMLAVSSRRKIVETSQLIGSADRRDQAELQWRIAAPMSVFLLALLAVPLAHTSPREGRYGKLVLGIVAYLIYSNLLGVGQTWLAKGVVPARVGLWWVHAAVAGLAALLIARRLGWRPQLLALRRVGP
ncbi:MAG: LPS export ABC transporter permease LptF [Gammaproteobacteria bacterium]|nr:LPS export ABC transporter permease LptF [Gammaproteobacteria bacterium]